MKLKGEMVIELTYVNTNETETITEQNMVTNLVNNLLGVNPIFFYLSNEGLSLVENAAYLGLPIPSKLRKVLEQLHDRSEKENEKEGEE